MGLKKEEEVWANESPSCTFSQVLVGTHVAGGFKEGCSPYAGGKRFPPVPQIGNPLSGKDGDTSGTFLHLPRLLRQL